ncbi:MAG: GDYXXLXY domain-containing protein [Synergistaceae bacterium]|jgi:uncharacterized membrane-anchored protein|nr:GDYXXLXY domain-containing protein [Synergistaceae bacterium]
MRRAFRYLLVILLPLAVLLTRPATSALVLALGKEIRLPALPVDPRDIFRGDYVDLRFNIEEIPVEQADPTLLRRLKEEKEKTGDAALSSEWVYVALAPDEKGIYRPVRVTETPSSEEICIRGRVELSYDQSELYIDYGSSLKRFYVKENTGFDLERAGWAGNLEALVRVWKNRAVLDRLEVTEKRE